MGTMTNAGHLRVVGAMIAAMTLAATARGGGQQGLDPAFVNDVGRALFGDYGPVYLLTGRTPTRINLLNGRRLPAEEGPMSERMRRMRSQMLGKDQPRQARRPAATRLLRFDQRNVAVRVPTHGWTRHELTENEARRCLLLSRADPDVFVSLSSEPVGIEARETPNSVLAASQDRMKRIPGGVVLPGVERLSARGIPGHAYRSTATFETGKELHYATWAATKNGYNYTLVVYGDVRDQQRVDRTMRWFVSNVSQIEPRRVAHAGHAPTVR